MFYTGTSDHFLIYTIRTTKHHLQAQHGHNRILYRQLQKLDTQNFIHDLSCQQWEILDTIEDIDLACTKWIDMFMNVVDSHVPL